MVLKMIMPVNKLLTSKRRIKMLRNMVEGWIEDGVRVLSSCSDRVLELGRQEGAWIEVLASVDAEMLPKQHVTFLTSVLN